MASLLVEYAKSGRSRCRKCKQCIEQDALRVGQEMLAGDYSQASWYHLACMPKGKMRKAPAADYKGFKDLKKKDQKALKAELEGTAAPAAAVAAEDATPAKRGRAAKDAAAVPAKKAKAAAGLSWKGYTPAQYKRFKELKEELADKSNDQLKTLCRNNDQKVTGTKDELIERVADGMLLGAIPKCGACGGGRLRFEPKTGTYTCPGYMEDEDFIRCNKSFSLSEVTRTNWQG